MKPFILVAINMLKTVFWKVKNPNIQIKNPILVGYNTKLSFAKGSEVQISGHLVSDGRLVIIVGENGNLNIQDNVYFNEGGMISCHEMVSIGRGCKFGPNVKIFDNNHCYNRYEGVLDSHNTGAVSIGNRCWIGSNAVILKGAKIGDNCVIGAGCIVDTEIPPYSIVTQHRELEIKAMREL